MFFWIKSELNYKLAGLSLCLNPKCGGAQHLDHKSRLSTDGLYRDVKDTASYASILKSPISWHVLETTNQSVSIRAVFKVNLILGLRRSSCTQQQATQLRCKTPETASGLRGWNDAYKRFSLRFIFTTLRYPPEQRLPLSMREGCYAGSTLCHIFHVWSLSLSDTTVWNASLHKYTDFQSLFPASLSCSNSHPSISKPPASTSYFLLCCKRWERQQ